MNHGRLTSDQIAAYLRDGFTTVRALFDREEIDMLNRTAKQDRALDQHSVGKDDGTGRGARLAIWNHPGDGIYGMFARSRTMVDSVEQVLADEAYHYHSKMIMKDARVGGAWAWHQDYGYWYQNGVLTPDLCSVSIAVDPATRENGCLEVLKGSHLMGRIDHVLAGDQAGADLERVEHAKQRFERVYCTMDPGDALFFHANLLHASAPNNSEHPRWSMICCYNAKSNNPYKESRHPRYTPLVKIENSMIKTIGKKRFEEQHSSLAWMDSEQDVSARVLKPTPQR